MPGPSASHRGIDYHVCTRAQPEDSGAEGHVNSTVWVQMTPELANDGVRCHAHNRYGEAETSFSLRIRKSLEVPGGKGGFLGQGGH